MQLLGFRFAAKKPFGGKTARSRHLHFKSPNRINIEIAVAFISIEPPSMIPGASQRGLRVVRHFFFNNMALFFVLGASSDSLIPEKSGIK